MVCNYPRLPVRIGWGGAPAQEQQEQQHDERHEELTKCQRTTSRSNTSPGPFYATSSVTLLQTNKVTVSFGIAIFYSIHKHDNRYPVLGHSCRNRWGGRRIISALPSPLQRPILALSLASFARRSAERRRRGSLVRYSWLPSCRRARYIILVGLLVRILTGSPGETNGAHRQDVTQDPAAVVAAGRGPASERGSTTNRKC